MIDFDLIKGRIGKFSRSSLIQQSLDLLNDVQRNKDKSYPFWYVLQLLKWVLMYGRKRVLGLKANRKDLIETLYLIETFDGQQKTIDFKLGLARGFRIIAYQQFWFQDYVVADTFARQIVLYRKIDTPFDVDNKFKHLTGFTTNEFLKCCLCTFLYINHDLYIESGTHHDVIDKDFFDGFASNIPPDRIRKFIDLLKVDQQSLSRLQKMSNEKYQIYEAHFWMTQPFLLFRGRYHLPHRTIFNQTSKHFIYDYLKANTKEFTTDFGERLEKYVELGLAEAQLRYLNETSLEKMFASLTKVCDFQIDDNILMECKAIELHPRAGIIRSADILHREFATSLIKSYQQLLHTAAVIDKSRTWYGIIVTYKETFVGFGADAWEEFLEKPITEIVEKEMLDISTLPPQNLIFLEIESWDHIVQVLADKRASILEMVQKLIELNTSSNPDEKILLPEQGLRKFYTINKLNLSFLTEAQKELDLSHWP